MTANAQVAMARRPDAPSPAAIRADRGRWRDPRLALGVLLVAASMILGARVVGAAEDTRPVWGLTRDLVAGTALAADDVTVRHVRLDGAANPYLAGSVSPVGAVLSRDLGAGELVPAAALTRAGAPDERLVTVPVGRDRLPLGLAAGQRVDVYAAPLRDGGAAAPAAFEPGNEAGPVVRGVRVAEVEDADARFGPSGHGRVSLAVPRDDVAALVAAMASAPVDLVRAP